MSKILFSTILIGSVIAAGSANNYSTTSTVTLAGAIVKASQSETVAEKYKRKDCPVCKGKGWYLSGDGIAKINCQYCEP